MSGVDRLLTLIVVAYKTIMSILFFESEAELRAIGYPGHERYRYRLPLEAAAKSDAHP